MKTKTILILIFLGIFLSAGCLGPKYDDPNPARPVFGNPDANIIVEDFSDFQCPACGAAEPTVQQVLKLYSDKILFKYKQFPLVKIHQNAFNSAMASECANDQNKFWEMHDILFKNQETLDRGRLSGYAKDIGLNMELFEACMNSNAKSSIVNKEMIEGVSRGVDSTPTFFINGEKIQNWGFLKTEIEKKLKK
ncbi:MAG: thioredoxin domain-containing protein [Candidatus Diapherotrites archaeon]|nr:thioredoxin domain-containing protein [Candidatus Diapherotrites archaeon]